MKTESEKLSRLLHESLDSEVRVILTDNRNSIISARKTHLGWTVRLHHMFCGADRETLITLTRFLNGPTNADKQLLRSFIKENEHKIRQQPSRGARATRFVTRGRRHDLRPIFDQLNLQYFQGSMDIAITWGRRSGKRAPKSVRLGSYDPSKEVIRVNPCLDRSAVPQYVIKGIVFHEMLHHVIPAKTVNGRRIIHSRRFRELERSYPDHERILDWKRRNLNKLLS